jgi:glycosyltransferase involved in cell wall biosynthesis
MTACPKRLRLLVVTGHRIISRKLESKLAPLLCLNAVEKVYLVTGSGFCHEKVRCFFPKGRLAVTPLVSHVWSVLTVLAILVRNTPNIVISVGLIPHGIYTLLLAAVFARKKIFLSMGMNELIYSEDHWAGRILRKIAFLSDLIGTRGTRSKAHLVRAGFKAERIFIPHNVFNFDHFKPVVCDKIYDLIYVGLLEPYKRIDLLMEAVRRLVKNRDLKEIRLAVVGEGSLKGRLADLSQRLGLGSHIDFVPAGGAEYVCSMLNQSKIFVMTSQREGLPMAMIEAMSCGLPVVIFDDADIGDVVRNGENGFLIRPGDLDGFAEALSGLLMNPDLYKKLRVGALRIRAEYKQSYSLGGIRAVWERGLVRFGR